MSRRDWEDYKYKNLQELEEDKITIQNLISNLSKKLIDSDDDELWYQVDELEQEVDDIQEEIDSIKSDTYEDALADYRYDEEKDRKMEEGYE